MAYASVDDVKARMTRDLTPEEENVCEYLLNDIAVLIDSTNKDAPADAKMIVSCRVAARMLGNGAIDNIPPGASQGSMSALGYSQSWSIGSGGAVGEIYLSKVEKLMLGAGNSIGTRSPLEDHCVEVES